MTLSLPADLEGHADHFEQMHSPGVYALELARPEFPGIEWAKRYETRPAWWEWFIDATEVLYVGASTDVLRRLEEHRDSEVRRASVLTICDITDIRGVWWFDDVDIAFERESSIAIDLQNKYPGAYVHQR